MDYDVELQAKVNAIEFTGKRVVVRENEEALIGGVLKGGTPVYNRVREIVKPEMFGNTSYGEIWNAIERLFEKGLGIDPITVGDELERVYKLEEVRIGNRSGRGLLTDLRDMGDPRNVESYAELVEDYHVKKALEEAGKWMIVHSANGRPAAAIMQDVMQKVSQIVLHSSGASEHIFNLSDAVSSAYDETVNASKGLIKRVQSGIVDLDRILNGGYTGGQLVLIAARPGQGKTALLLTKVLNMIREGRKVLFISLEMSARECAQRLISQMSSIDVGRLQAGKLTPEEWNTHAQAVDELSAMKELLTVVDMPAMKLGNIRQVVRREVAKGKLDAVMVDYLQLAEADDKKTNRYQEVGVISRGLKALARETDLPILAAAQLSRAPQDRKDKRPQLSDLRESGDLEQDADIVMMLYKENEEIKAEITPIELLVRKHRNGATGMIELQYKARITRFEGTRKV